MPSTKDHCIRPNVPNVQGIPSLTLTCLDSTAVHVSKNDMILGGIADRRKPPLTKVTLNPPTFSAMSAFQTTASTLGFHGMFKPRSRGSFSMSVDTVYRSFHLFSVRGFEDLGDLVHVQARG